MAEIKMEKNKWDTFQYENLLQQHIHPPQLQVQRHELEREHDLRMQQLQAEEEQLLQDSFLQDLPPRLEIQSALQPEVIEEPERISPAPPLAPVVHRPQPTPHIHHPIAQHPLHHPQILHPQPIRPHEVMPHISLAHHTTIHSTIHQSVIQQNRIHQPSLFPESEEKVQQPSRPTVLHHAPHSYDVPSIPQQPFLSPFPFTGHFAGFPLAELDYRLNDFHPFTQSSSSRQHSMPSSHDIPSSLSLKEPTENPVLITHPSVIQHAPRSIIEKPFPVIPRPNPLFDRRTDDIFFNSSLYRPHLSLDMAHSSKQEQRHVDRLHEDFPILESLACIEKREEMKRHSVMHDCQVCQSTHANGLHFGARTCAACAAFFRRSISDDKHYVCKRNQRCTSASRDGTGYRKICRSCRMKRCLDIGMLPENVQHKRTRKDDDTPPNKSFEGFFPTFYPHVES
ncbi:unnamed protein product [Caenorhabditis auriculariae]|uniref:Nuclear receptor domain-containing protein n=1 Tax=Caenorhabditis auriculariae TaxID=2777116 RepID=A0A8S1GZ59_9PELO|nr:unnamed protein product [Caenorhabditis auriculariae]